MPRELRLVFGEVADTYDRVRPSYPSEMVDRVFERGGLRSGDRAVEVGAGTGKGTELMAARGLRIIAVEPSAEMAAELRRRIAPAGDAVRVDIALFEDWALRPDDELADLVYSAQAWHWVPPESRTERAAAALRPGGLLALWWNRPDARDDDLRRALDEVYDRVAPDLAKGSRNRIPAHRPEGPRGPALVELDGSPGFHDVVVEGFPWSRWYSTDDYLALLGTYSDHRMLDPDVRARLLAGVRDVLDAHGGGIDHGYVTDLVTARKRVEPD